MIGKVLSIASTPLQVKQLIRGNTSMFFISWEMQYDENGQGYGQLVISSFIMTMCPLMHHNSCRVFWQNIKSPRWLSRPTAQIWLPVTFCLFPKLKSPSKGKRFQIINKIQENMMGQLMAIPTKDFAKCFEQWKRHWENWSRS